MARKQFKISDMTNKVNLMLKTNTRPKLMRQGIIQVMDQILVESGNYRGFRFLTQKEVPVGELPGIHYEDGNPLPYPQRFDNTDETRIQFINAD